MTGHGIPELGEYDARTYGDDRATSNIGLSTLPPTAGRHVAACSFRHHYQRPDPPMAAPSHLQDRRLFQAELPVSPTLAEAHTSADTLAEFVPRPVAQSAAGHAIMNGLHEVIAIGAPAPRLFPLGLEGRA